MDDIDDSDVDGILDEALEEFEQTKPAASDRTNSARSAEEKQTQEVPSSSSTGEEPATLPQPDEINPAFREALDALGNLGLGQEKIDEEVTENDLKLVEEFMTSLSSSLNGLGVPGDSNNENTTRETNDNGRENQPEVEKLVDSIVGHLLSEDVLKGPMIQMKEAYAEWLPKNVESLSAEEFGRYSRQQELIEVICEKYESNAASSEIMELLSTMQETGAPPEDIMKSLNSASESTVDPLMGMQNENMEKLTENCPMQ